MPQNTQCDVAVNSAINSKWLTTPPKDLSVEGQGLVQDLRDAIEKAKLLFLSKNDGQLIQEFFWETQQIGSANAQNINKPVDKDAAGQDATSQDAAKALEGLKTLGALLVTNGEFRKLCKPYPTILKSCPWCRLFIMV
jgi:hypothetical protein